MNMKRETGHSCGAFDRARFEAYAKAGIDCLEISPAQNDSYNALDFPAIRTLADEYGLRLNSFHLRFAPFQNVNITALDADIRRQTVEYQKGFIQRGADVGIPIFVIHPSDEPFSDDIRPTKIAYAKECLAELADFAAACGVTVAVEDLPRTCLGNCSKELLDIISVDDRLRICFDTNHMLSEPLDDFLRACAHKIVTTHVSDYDFKNERHWLPGEGDVNWKSLFDTFDEVGYEGPILYELSLIKESESITRERALTPEDLMRNHRELEARKPLTVLGVRTPGLKDWRVSNWYTKKK